MTPRQRREINIETLGSEKAHEAWLKATDALHEFARVTDTLAGIDVLDWYREQSEACFLAQEAAARSARHA